MSSILTINNNEIYSVNGGTCKSLSQEEYNEIISTPGAVQKLQNTLFSLEIQLPPQDRGLKNALCEHTSCKKYQGFAYLLDGFINLCPETQLAVTKGWFKLY